MKEGIMNYVKQLMYIGWAEYGNDQEEREAELQNRKHVAILPQ